MKRIFLGLGFIMLATTIYAKPFRGSKLKEGKLTKESINKIAVESKKAKNSLTQKRYEEVVINPENASDTERLAAMTGREFFLLVDRSLSMMNDDENPTGEYKSQWTRWDSARVAAESIGEVVLSLDKNNIFQIMLWNGKPRGDLVADYKDVTDINQISGFFKNHEPNGNTPLAAALEDVSKKYLSPLLKNEEPFTVVILTDGAPNYQKRVEKFFKKFIKDHKLEKTGREYLAAFSFVRVGDDPQAMEFLEDLDDNLIDKLGVQVDIVDTKEDNFLFGTGKYKNQSQMGPFDLLWDAIFD